MRLLRSKWYFLLALSFTGLILACESPDKKNAEPGIEATDSAKWVINRAIHAHGGPIDSAVLSFKFRDKMYSGMFLNGRYELIRSFTKDNQQVIDILSNSKSPNFTRSINQIVTPVAIDKANAYSNSINSVFYFAMLPQKLADSAVVSSYMGKEAFEEKLYHKIKVSFMQQGGGEDFEDEFMYWFNSKTMLLDYMAYSYKTNGGGVRFRATTGRHKTSRGFILQDYDNYQPKDSAQVPQLSELLRIYGNSGLVKLSEINLERAEVR